MVRNGLTVFPEDLQTLLTETAQEIGKETAADVMKEADEAEQQMKDAGLTVIEPDVQPFKDASRACL